MSTIRTLNDRILVKRCKPAETSKGGIIIPDNAKEKPVEGEVLVVGSGKLLDDGTRAPVDVKVGDRVLFGKYVGQEVTVDGDEQVILREDDILAVIAP